MTHYTVERLLPNDLAGFIIGLASDGSARGCPLQSAVAGDITVRCLTTSHGVRTGFPVHFLAAPMETFLETPAFHPNIYPETGFVSLRVQHRVSDIVRSGLDKLAAKLSGHLENTATLHVMRLAAREHRMPAGAMPLLSVPYVSARGSDPTVPGGRRLRRQ